ncbi:MULTISPECIES: NUDIX hydrolase [unclassified Carboxylicivirga]|uniref:NUDIX hydrolase n=1 Tax=Carboxylicivirga TaxID=1628153 RepID=UPI003D3403BF
MDTPKQFNIRVYGLLINEQQEVLITDEYRIGMLMTKFPGGGLEFGEGTIDCLKREFMEELGLPIEVESHFYTTDYFQAAISFENTQLMSIYYRVKTNTTEPIQTSHHSNDIPAVDGAQSFRWMPIRHLNSEEFTFPIDKIVAEMLKSDCIRAL